MRKAGARGSRLTATCRLSLKWLRVQAGELTVPVLLDTRRSPDLAACGDRYRTRRHQNQIRDAKTVRVGDRRGNFTLDGGELVRCLLVRLAPLLDFDDDDKLLRVTHPEPLSPRTDPL